jgi:hypothetical protein
VKQAEYANAIRMSHKAIPSTSGSSTPIKHNAFKLKTTQDNIEEAQTKLEKVPLIPLIHLDETVFKECTETKGTSNCYRSKETHC